MDRVPVRRSPDSGLGARYGVPGWASKGQKGTLAFQLFRVFRVFRA